VNDDLMSRIATWCSDEPGMEYADGEPPTITFEDIVIAIEGGGHRIVLTHRARQGDNAAAASAAGAVMLRITEHDDGTTVTHPLYADGLTAQDFMRAVYAVTAAGRVLAATAPATEEAARPEPTPAEEPATAAPIAAIEPEPTAAEEPETEAEPAAAAAPGAEPSWAPTHRVSPGMRVWPQPDPQAQPIAQFQEPTEIRVEEERGAWARISRSDGWGGWVDGRRLDALGAAAAAAETSQQVAPQAEPESPTGTAWSPTHVVPAGGMAAWPEPDPQQQPTAQLSERVQLRIDERRGAWAKVTGSNGWTGWVDARRLEAVSPGTAPRTGGGVDMGGLRVRLLGGVGAVLALLSIVLPWLAPPFGGSSNGFDVPTAFLWDYAASSGLKLGVVVLVVAAAGLVVALMMRIDARVGAALGFVMLLIGVVFVIQVMRAIGDEFDLSFMDAVTDWLGFGTWLAIGGGVLMLIGGLTDR
jgi:SH3-like domain-containing protein